MNRGANAGFFVRDSFENLVGNSQLAKMMKSGFGLSDRTVKSVGGVSAYIGLYDIGAGAIVSVFHRSRLVYIKFQLSFQVLACEGLKK